MKALTTFLFLSLMIFSHLIVSGQNMVQLNIDNGFKKFKFGSSSELVKTKKKMEIEYSFKNVDIYIYTGNDMSKVYGVDIKEIELWYYRKKLFRISLNIGSLFKEYTLDEYNVLKNGFEIKYGTSWVSTSKQTDVLNSAIWDGQRIRLEHVRYDLTHGRQDGYNHIVGYINIYDKDVNEQQAKDELSE